MIHKSTWLVLLMVFPLIAFAQRERKVSGEYTYYAPLNVSPDAAVATAIEKARIQALADAFGTLIDMHSTNLIQNENGKSNSNFFSLGESSVKGEWLGDTRDPKTEVWIEEGFLIANAKVWGEAREIVSAPIDVQAKLLRTPKGKNDTEHYAHGDDLYLSFKSPAKGFLAVYQIDAQGDAYCLLPYANDEDGQFPVKANKNYILFATDYSDDPNECDEYVMTCDRTGTEQNMFYIIFSPNKFTKANDDHAKGSVDVEGQKLLLPRFLPFSDFQKWLLKCRRDDKDMQVVIKPVSITRE